MGEKISDPNIPSAQSKVEEEKLPLINIIYRDNDLYTNFVPKIAQNIESFGRRVATKSFPREASVQEIKKYFESDDVKGSLKGTELFADETCRGQVDYKFRSDNFKKEYYLDSFANRIMSHCLIGKELIEKNDDTLCVPEKLVALKNIVKEVIDKNGEPENLYVVNGRISDHDFNNNLFSRPVEALLEKKLRFSTYINIKDQDERNKNKELREKEIVRLKSLNEEEFLSVLENNSEFKETINLGFDKDKLINIINLILKEGDETDSQQLVWNNFVANKIKEFLKDVIDEEKIRTISNPWEVESGDNDYFIVDRHAQVEYRLYKGGVYKSKIILPLPLADMIESIVKNNLLDINFNVDKAIETEVEKMFSGEKNKE